MGQARQRKLAGEYPEPSPSQWATETIASKRDKKGISPIPFIHKLWAAARSKFLGRRDKNSTPVENRIGSYAEAGGLR